MPADILQALVLVNIGHLHPSQIPSHCQTKQSYLQCGQYKLEQHEARVAIDTYKVLPC